MSRASNLVLYFNGVSISFSSTMTLEVVSRMLSIAYIIALSLYYGINEEFTSSVAVTNKSSSYFRISEKVDYLEEKQLALTSWKKSIYSF